MTWSLTERDIKELAPRTGNIAKQVFGEDFTRFLYPWPSHWGIGEIAHLRRLTVHGDAESRHFRCQQCVGNVVCTIMFESLNRQALGYTIRLKKTMCSYPINNINRTSNNIYRFQICGTEIGEYNYGIGHSSCLCGRKKKQTGGQDGLLLVSFFWFQA